MSVVTDPRFLQFRQMQIDGLPWMKKQRRQALKRMSLRAKLINLPWTDESIKVIREKIVHYEKTGNQNKLAIYRLKLDDKMSLKGRLVSMMK